MKKVWQKGESGRIDPATGLPYPVKRTTKYGRGGRVKPEGMSPYAVKAFAPRLVKAIAAFLGFKEMPSASIRAHIIRVRLLQILTMGDNQSALAAAKMLGQDKEVNMWEPDTQVGVAIGMVPADWNARYIGGTGNANISRPFASAIPFRSEPKTLEQPASTHERSSGGVPVPAETTSVG